MKRMRLHVSLPSVEQAVAFCTTSFNAPPSVLKTDAACC